MNREFWQGKNVFITGHTGFKGGWLSLWLQKLGANVSGYALEPPTTPSLFELAKVEAGMQSFIGNLSDFEALSLAIQKAKPDIVFHMAAQPLVRYSYRHPVETYQTNVLGTVHLLEAVRPLESVRAVVNVTSDKCYENHNWEWGYREIDRLGGHDPYSNSKACAELVTSAYRSSYFSSSVISLASARSGNVIGGGDWADDRLIPDAVRSVSSGDVLQIRRPDATRPWQHVLEPLAGYLILAEHLYLYQHEFDGGWNFGPVDNDISSVGEVAQRLSEHWNGALKFNLLGTENLEHEATLLRLDCSKSMNQLGWHPVWTLDETLLHTVDWYRAHVEEKCMNDVCLKQLGMYEDALNAKS